MQVVNTKDVDANILRFIRVLKRLGLLSRATYTRIGHELLYNGNSKKDKWRQANWDQYLKSG